MNLDALRQIGKAQDRVSAPISAGDGGLIKADRLAQGPARRLYDTAFDLVAHTVGIDDLAAVIGGHAAQQPDLSALVLYFQFDGHRRVGRRFLYLAKAKPRPTPLLAVAPELQPNFSAASCTTSRARLSCR